MAVFGLVLLTERADGVLYTKPVSEDMGPAEDQCPARILDLLSAPSSDQLRTKGPIATRSQQAHSCPSGSSPPL